MTPHHKHFIREWRQHRGLNQEQFADRLGIERSYVSKIETGKRRYDQFFLEAAADALGVTPADLLTRDPADPEGIWSIWDRLKPKEREQAINVLRALVGLTIL